MHFTENRKALLTTLGGRQHCVFVCLCLVSGLKGRHYASLGLFICAFTSSKIRGFVSDRVGQGREPGSLGTSTKVQSWQAKG